MEKIKIYVVTSGEYSDYGIDGIFSTQEKAQQYIDTRRASKSAYSEDINGIDEWALDEKLEECEFIKYSCGIILESGEIKERGEGPYFGIKKNSVEVIKNVPYIGGLGLARAESFKSAEHAMKLAVEARQKWLRNKQYDR